VQELENGAAVRTLQNDQTSIWYAIEFARADLPIGELPADFARRWIEWLRDTPQAPRRPRSMPKVITPQTVHGFLTWPPKRRVTEKPRLEQTIGRFWRHGRPFFEFLGLDTRLPKKKRRPGLKAPRDHAPRLVLPPPLVPKKREIVGWWTAYLAGGGPATIRQRRRVVLMQGLLLLTGMRLGECLAGLQPLQEGQWLLLHKTKTHRPRIIYVSAQALGIVKALRDYNPRTLFAMREDERFAGWRQTESSWQRMVRRCRQPRAADAEPEKHHQGLRKALSTWLRARDPDAEAAQLGHGRGVVLEYYADVLRRLPRLLERLRLPAVPGIEWPAPIAAERAFPRRLWNVFRRLVEEG
jgi:integrase